MIQRDAATLFLHICSQMFNLDLAKTGTRANQLRPNVYQSPGRSKGPGTVPYLMCNTKQKETKNGIQSKQSHC